MRNVRNYKLNYACTILHLDRAIPTHLCYDETPQHQVSQRWAVAQLHVRSHHSTRLLNLLTVSNFIQDLYSYLLPKPGKNSAAPLTVISTNASTHSLLGQALTTGSNSNVRDPSFQPLIPIVSSLTLIQLASNSFARADSIDPSHRLRLGVFNVSLFLSKINKPRLEVKLLKSPRS